MILKRAGRPLFSLFIVLSLLSCSPGQSRPISDYSLNQMASQQAILDWAKVLQETDECSSTNGLHWLAETFLDKNWWDCCYQHDFDYRVGSKYGIDKEQADWELWQCVDASGHPFVANVMYDAVVLLGDSSWQEWGE